MRLANLPTPSLVLDRQRLDDNLRRMQARADALGVRLRPHLKTAKSADAAARAADLGARGITVSTLKEARYFLESGVTDILYGVGIVPARLDAAAALRADGANLAIVTDNLDVARAIAAHDGEFSVLVEIDTGAGRAGIAPDDPVLVDIARAVQAAPRAQLAGVMTHAGHAYHAAGPDGVRAIAAAERDGVVAAAGALRDAGFGCPMVSVGSTPTAMAVDHLAGVTEMRPGVYMFGDLDQQAIGSCGRDDIALSVLAAVIGHNRAAGTLLIDAGGLALSKDRGATEFRPEVGYGEVCDAETLEPLVGLYVADCHQEHGIVPVPDPRVYGRLPIGAKVRVLPNHACMTAAAWDSYAVVEGEAVVGRWPRVNGW